MAAQSLPIDIHYNKLLDWLIDRRHCDLRWHHQLQEVKDKIKKGLLSLPNKEDSFISSILNKEDINYCDCSELMEHLLTVEPNEKNFIGQYTSAVLKVWDDVLKSYQKKNLHLAEGGQLMCRLVNYEVASLKRQITKCQLLQKELARKANDSQINSRALQTKFDEQCQELGIEGKEVYNELTVLLSTQLPLLFSEITSLANHLQTPVNYYQIFRNCTLSSSSNSEKEVLKLLKFFIEHGNVTVYEWENGSPPPELITDTTCTTDTVSSVLPVESEATINWGDLEGEVGGGEEGGGVIDFGDADIDFDISLDQIDMSGITLEDEGGGGGGASDGTSKQVFLTLLEDIDTRNLLMDDLLELSEFIKQRINELSTSTTNSSGTNLLQVELPASVQSYSSTDLIDMLSNVTLVIDKCTNKRSQQLLLMLGSQSYLERLSTQLTRQKELIQKTKSLIDQHRHTINETGEKQLKLEESLTQLVTEIKRIKTMVSKEISKKYDNRTVNITGEINQL